MFLREFQTDGQVFDSGLVLSFKGPHSFTGEDAVEFQCHGSEVVVRKLMTALGERGARPATRGEFSYRGFLNGKLSEQALENLADVFLAKDSKDLDDIYSRREGSMERFAGQLRESLLGIQAILDTAVDFAEEYSAVVDQARTPIDKAIHDCSLAIQRYCLLRDGGAARRLVLAGLPNAGKSSLFNAIIGRYRTIVTAEPGTTRDVVEEEVELGGTRWRIVDTAGVRSPSGEAEAEGLRLGESFLGSADYWLLVVDGSQGMTTEESALLERHGKKPHLVVWNKKDLAGWRLPPEGALGVSAQTGEGVVGLLGWLNSGLNSPEGDLEVPLPSASQAAILRGVHRQLLELKAELEAGLPPEVLGERCRVLMGEIPGVIGSVDTEAVLDRVFGEFCIGK